MSSLNSLPLALGLILFSFFITSSLMIPFIDLLYRLKLTRRKEAPKKGKVPLFDKLHDKKAGTPIGGGILLLTVIIGIFAFMFPFASRMGIFIQCAYRLKTELFVIYFTLVSFGLLGLFDDLVKIFGSPKKGALGMWVGLSRGHKFTLQAVLSVVIAYMFYQNLGVHIVNIPLFDKVIDLGFWYVPFASLVILIFTNAVNISDGLDGLAPGLLVICLFAFGAIVAGGLDLPLSMLIAIWIGTLIAFLYFNVWPARLLLGDSGALSFGAMLAVVGLLTGSIVALFVIGGIFLAEIASSAIQILGWRYLKKPIFPLAPIHHAFLARGWEEPKIVIRAWLAGLILAIFGIWLALI